MFSRRKTDLFRIEKTAQQFIKESARLNYLVFTIESCTGGLIASTLTDVPGSSNAFWGGMIAYHNNIKHTVLGVPPETLSSSGAVSPQVAQALADGGIKLMANAAQYDEYKNKRLICISTTGIAGPSGGSAEKPVGLCFVGLAIKDKPTTTKRICAPATFDRLQNKSFFAKSALDMAIEGIFGRLPVKSS
ncbi:MAG: nicotinamide-nucleotide amidohydrolase family protein [Bdellovibrionota bacterium]